MKRLPAWLLGASCMLMATGCCTGQRRPGLQSQPVPPPAPRPVLPASPAPISPGVFQPAPAAPQGIMVPPPAPSAAPFPTVPPPPNTSGAGLPPQESIARVENRWQPADAGVLLGAPEPITDPGPKTA